MSSPARRALAVVAAVATFGLLAVAPAALAAPAPKPVVPAAPPADVIVIPGPDQVSHAIDASRCPWLKAYIAALSEGVVKLETADGHTVSAAQASLYAMLLTAPLVAAQYGLDGMSGPDGR